MNKALKPEVSIIVVSYNCKDVINACVDSCIAIPNAETIVIDNNSKDGTADILESFSTNITFTKSESNVGFTKGCNLGISIAKGKYILLLNPDAQLLPDTVDRLVKHMEGDELIGAVAPHLIYPDGGFQNYTRTFPTIKGLAVEHFVPSRFQSKFKSLRKYLCLDLDFSKDIYVDQPAGAAILFRNNGLLLDESYFIYGSDVDLCKRIISSGYKIKQITDAQVIHHQSKGGTHIPNIELKTYLDLDNYYGMRLYFRNYAGRHKEFLYLFVFTIGLVASLIPGFFKGPKAIYFRLKRIQLFWKGANFYNYLHK